MAASAPRTPPASHHASHPLPWASREAARSSLARFQLRPARMQLTTSSGRNERRRHSRGNCTVEFPVREM